MDGLSESHKPIRQNNSLFIFPLKTGDGAETSSQPAVQIPESIELTLTFPLWCWNFRSPFWSQVSFHVARFKRALRLFVG